MTSGKLSWLIAGWLGLALAAPAWAASYTTTFPLTENPISEGSHWAGGQSAGGNLWGDVQTGGIVAFGVSEPTSYGDPTAILTGVWGQSQTASAVVKITQAQPGGCCHEAEVRLRSAISANSITGYEVYCSVLPADPYCHIARWNGPNGSWCNLESSAPLLALGNGDTLTATVTGTNPVIITGYRNGVQIMQALDTGQDCSPGGPAGPFTSGNPGIGFYDNQDNNWSGFGFSRFTATDGLPVSTPSASPTLSPTRTVTLVVSSTPTPTASPTRTSSPVVSVTPTFTISATRTVSVTRTMTLTATATGTPGAAGPATPIGSATPEAAGIGVKVYPNPWRRDRNAGTPVRFMNLPAGSRVRIFTVDGGLVAALDAEGGSAAWQCNWESASSPKGGIYIYLVSDASGRKRTGKIALVR